MNYWLKSILLRISAMILGNMIVGGYTLVASLITQQHNSESNYIGVFWMVVEYTGFTLIFTMIYGLIPSMVIDLVLKYFKINNWMVRGALYVLTGTLIPITGNILALSSFLSLMLLESRFLKASAS